MSGQVSDVYQYDHFTEKLINQLFHIADDLYRDGDSYNDFWEVVVILQRELGKVALSNHPTRANYQSPARDELYEYMINVDAEECLDAAEVILKYIDIILRDRYCATLGENTGRKMCDDALSEANHRFKQSQLGYSYISGELIRVDSSLLHADVVKPALKLLQKSGYESAQHEYLDAYDHYRNGRNQESLVEALKSFESVIKIIAHRRNWTVPERPTASQLVDVCLSNNLLPTYNQSSLTGLRLLLESAIPTPRNRRAGHGAGAQPVVEPEDYVVAYVLHVTAATILLLTEADAQMP